MVCAQLLRVSLNTAGHGIGTAYLLYASDNNQNFKISQLDTNYYNVTSVVSQLNGVSDRSCLVVCMLIMNSQVRPLRRLALSNGMAYALLDTVLRHKIRNLDF